jgi:hypothetical protein
MDSRERMALKAILWTLLACCGLIDGALGEAAISGCCDVVAGSGDGGWIAPRPQPEIWPWLGLFVAFQALLIFATLRVGRKHEIREWNHINEPGVDPTDSGNL